MWLVIILGILIVSFGGVLLVGAPYLPTTKPQIEAAIKLAGLKKGQHLLELGCGDGRVLLAAARAGYKVTGYELNPLLAAVAWLRTRRYRRQVKVVWGDFWAKDWPPAQAVFTFLLPRYMAKLDVKIKAYKSRPLNLVSFAFQIPDRPASRHRQGVYLYIYK